MRKSAPNNGILTLVRTKVQENWRPEVEGLRPIGGDGAAVSCNKAETNILGMDVTEGTGANPKTRLGSRLSHRNLYLKEEHKKERPATVGELLAVASW